MKANIGKFHKVAERKIQVDIEKFDSWNAAHTIAYIAFPLLLQLKATQHGIPSSFVPDNYHQTSFDFMEETEAESHEQYIKQWEETLDKMIWSFQQLVHEDYQELYHHGTPEYTWEDTGKDEFNPVTRKVEKIYQLKDNNPNDHWYDIEGHKLHEERIQEGLELFGKYFINLWD